MDKLGWIGSQFVALYETKPQPFFFTVSYYGSNLEKKSYAFFSAFQKLFHFANNNWIT